MASKDRVTRVSADLMDSAAAEGSRQQRSTAQQLAYWARVGREVTAPHTVSHRRIEAALAGLSDQDDLSAEEFAVFNAEVAARVAEDLSRIDFGAVLAARGVTTVSLNESGELVERRPDGTSSVVTG